MTCYVLVFFSRYRQPCTPFELAVYTGAADCAAIFTEEDPVVYRSMLEAPAGYRYGEGFDDGWEYLPEADTPPSATKYARNDHMCIIALMRSTPDGAGKWVELFLKLGLDFSVPRSSGISLVGALIALGHASAAMAVLTNTKLKIDMNATDDKGRSLLFYACYSKRDDRTDVLRHLLENGADVTKAANDGTTPAMAAVRNNDLRSFLMIRNVSFYPYQATRLIKADDPRPVGCAKVLAEHVGLDGVKVYLEPKATAEVLATIPGQTKSFHVGSKDSKRRNSLVGTVLADESFSITGTMSIAAKAGTNGAVELTVEKCSDLAGVVDDGERSDPHIEVYMESDTKLKNVITTVTVEDELSPEFNEKITLQSTMVPSTEAADGKVSCKLSFDAELEQLTIEVVEIAGLKSASFDTACVEVSLMDGFGGASSGNAELSARSEMVKLEDKSTTLKIGHTFTFNVDAQQYLSKLLKIDLLSKGKALLGTSSDALGSMKVKAGSHDNAPTSTLSLCRMLWQYDHCVLEVWHGKRGGKKSKFLGHCRVDLAAAIKKSGSIEMNLGSIDSDDTWGAGVGVKVLNFETIPIAEVKGEWIHVHQTYYYDMLETFGSRPYDPCKGLEECPGRSNPPSLKLGCNPYVSSLVCATGSYLSPAQTRRAGFVLRTRPAGRFSRYQRSPRNS